MLVHCCGIFKEFWEDIELIVHENYSQYCDENDLVILADHHWKEIDTIKSLYPNCSRVIAFQTEPLVTNHWWPIEFIVERLKSADEVWDYDLENIQVLKTYGIEAKFRPFLYTEKLKRIEHNPNPDIDLLFYGYLNPRRYEIINKFLVRCNNEFSVVLLNGVSGKKLDDFIFRSKTILSLNAHSYDRQKQTRIIHPVINNKCVISEISCRNYFGNAIIEIDFSTDEYVEQIYQIIKYDVWKQYNHCSERYKQISNDVKTIHVTS